MRLTPRSWSTTLRKLGRRWLTRDERREKMQPIQLQNLQVETLEARQMLSGTGSGDDGPGEDQDVIDLDFTQHLPQVGSLLFDGNLADFNPTLDDGTHQNTYVFTDSYTEDDGDIVTIDWNVVSTLVVDATYASDGTWSYNETLTSTYTIDVSVDGLEVDGADLDQDYSVSGTYNFVFESFGYSDHREYSLDEDGTSNTTETLLYTSVEESYTLTANNPTTVFESDLDGYVVDNSGGGWVATLTGSGSGSGTYDLLGIGDFDYTDSEGDIDAGENGYDTRLFGDYEYSGDGSYLYTYTFGGSDYKDSAGVITSESTYVETGSGSDNYDSSNTSNLIYNDHYIDLIDVDADSATDQSDDGSGTDDGDGSGGSSVDGSGSGGSETGDGGDGSSGADGSDTSAPEFESTSTVAIVDVWTTTSDSSSSYSYTDTIQTFTDETWSLVSVETGNATGETTLNGTSSTVLDILLDDIRTDDQGTESNEYLTLSLDDFLTISESDNFAYGYDSTLTANQDSSQLVVNRTNGSGSGSSNTTLETHSTYFEFLDFDETDISSGDSGGDAPDSSGGSDSGGTSDGSSADGSDPNSSGGTTADATEAFATTISISSTDNSLTTVTDNFTYLFNDSTTLNSDGSWAYSIDSSGDGLSTWTMTGDGDTELISNTVAGHSVTDIRVLSEYQLLSAGGNDDYSFATDLDMTYTPDAESEVGGDSDSDSDSDGDGPLGSGDGVSGDSGSSGADGEPPADADELGGTFVITGTTSRTGDATSNVSTQTDGLVEVDIVTSNSPSTFASFNGITNGTLHDEVTSTGNYSEAITSNYTTTTTFGADGSISIDDIATGHVDGTYNSTVSGTTEGDWETDFATDGATAELTLELDGSSASAANGLFDYDFATDTTAAMDGDGEFTFTGTYHELNGHTEDYATAAADSTLATNWLLEPDEITTDPYGINHNDGGDGPTAGGDDGSSSGSDTAFFREEFSSTDTVGLTSSAEYIGDYDSLTTYQADGGSTVHVTGNGAGSFDSNISTSGGSTGTINGATVSNAVIYSYSGDANQEFEYTDDYDLLYDLTPVADPIGDLTGGNSGGDSPGTGGDGGSGGGSTGGSTDGSGDGSSGSGSDGSGSGDGSDGSSSSDPGSGSDDQLNAYLGYDVEVTGYYHTVGDGTTDYIFEANGSNSGGNSAAFYSETFTEDADGQSVFTLDNTYTFDGANGYSVDLDETATAVDNYDYELIGNFSQLIATGDDVGGPTDGGGDGSREEFTASWGGEVHTVDNSFVDADVQFFYDGDGEFLYGDGTIESNADGTIEAFGGSGTGYELHTREVETGGTSSGDINSPDGGSSEVIDEYHVSDSSTSGWGLDGEYDFDTMTTFYTDGSMQFHFTGTEQLDEGITASATATKTTSTETTIYDSSGNEIENLLQVDTVSSGALQDGEKYYDYAGDYTITTDPDGNETKVGWEHEEGGQSENATFDETATYRSDHYQTYSDGSTTHEWSQTTNTTDEEDHYDYDWTRDTTYTGTETIIVFDDGTGNHQSGSQALAYQLTDDTGTNTTTGSTDDYDNNETIPENEEPDFSGDRLTDDETESTVFDYRFMYRISSPVSPEKMTMEQFAQFIRKKYYGDKMSESDWDDFERRLWEERRRRFFLSDDALSKMIVDKIDIGGMAWSGFKSGFIDLGYGAKRFGRSVYNGVGSVFSTKLSISSAEMHQDMVNIGKFFDYLLADPDKRTKVIVALMFSVALDKLSDEAKQELVAGVLARLGGRVGGNIATNLMVKYIANKIAKKFFQKLVAKGIVRGVIGGAALGVAIAGWQTLGLIESLSDAEERLKTNHYEVWRAMKQFHNSSYAYGFIEDIVSPTLEDIKELRKKSKKLINKN